MGIALLLAFVFCWFGSIVLFCFASDFLEHRGLRKGRAAWLAWAFTGICWEVETLAGRHLLTYRSGSTDGVLVTGGVAYLVLSFMLFMNRGPSDPDAPPLAP